MRTYSRDDGTICFDKLPYGDQMELLARPDGGITLTITEASGADARVYMNDDEAVVFLSHISALLRKPTDSSVYSQEFQMFMRAYPRKVGKGAAWRIWKRTKDLPVLTVLLEAIRRQTQANSWDKPENRPFVPHPATWLNARRWEDEVEDGAETAKRRFSQGRSVKII